MSAPPFSAVLSLSGGVSSFLAARRYLDEWGSRGVAAVFADTLIEDPDVYRFVRESAAYLGVPFYWLKDGRDPWQVFADERYIGNSRAAKCSDLLKRRVVRRWMAENCSEGASLVLGFGFEEPERVARAVVRSRPWRVVAPLAVRPWMGKAEQLRTVAALGIAPPSSCALGFPHANCGGFCVRAGAAHFLHLLRVYPERFAHHEAQEATLSARLGGRSILRDSSGAPMLLSELRGRASTGGLFDHLGAAGCGCTI